MTSFINSRPRRPAFTLVEILVVVTLFVIIFGMVALYSQASQVRSDLNAQVAVFVSYARLQQSAAAVGKSSGSFGVHLESDSYVLFEGSVFDPNDSANDSKALPPTLAIQNISFNGGGSDFIFTPPHGETNHYGALDFYSTSLDKTITITLTSLGTLDY